ncbi:AMP-binding protein [Lentzea sp. JNUCC 0626]|uniref:AMP-binding protein n=1 Tax=Lentzea sp. JNUCC 0626 TaxID=3367513 RepID=UPI00374878CD
MTTTGSVWEQQAGVPAALDPRPRQERLALLAATSPEQGRHRAGLTVGLSGPLDEGRMRHVVEAVAARHGLTDSMHVSLLRRNDVEHELTLGWDRAVADAWSAWVLFDELALGYASTTPAPAAGKAARHSTSDEDLQHRVERLSGGTFGVMPPPDRPLENDGAAALRSLPLDRAVIANLTAAFPDVPEPVVLLTAFVQLLARFTAERDLTVALPVSGRPEAALQEIGSFENAVLIRVDLRADPTFRELLHAVHEEVMASLAHQRVPVEAVLAELVPGGYLDRGPLAAVSFDVVVPPPSSRDCGGVRMSVLDSAGPDAEFPLAMRIRPDHQVEVRHTGVHSPELVDSFLLAYRKLLAIAARRPDTSLSRLSLVDAPRAVVQQVRRRYPNVAEMVAAVDPALTALVSSGRSWTYGDLVDRASEVAETLRSLDVRPGQTVAICAGGRGFELYASMLGVWQAGAVLVMTDPGLPATLLDRTGTRTLLVTGEPPRWCRDADVDNVLVHDGDLAVVRRGGAGARALAERDAAYVFFTSGTTGVPKALLGRHNSLAHFLTWQRGEFRFEPGDRCAQLTSLVTDGVLRDIFTPLISGATLHVPALPPADPGILDWLRDEAVTSAHTMPTTSSRWLARADAVGELPALRRLFFSGEPMTGALAERWHRIAPNARLVNLYGTSECTMIQSRHRVSRTTPELTNPAGISMRGAEILVLTTGNAPCGPGEVGQPHVRTPYGTYGYVGQADGGFVPNPFRDDPRDRVFRTGDVARRRSNGALEVLGRASDEAVAHGVNVNPEHVNAVLVRQPGVRAAATVWAPHAAGRDRLVSFVVPDNASPWLVGAVRRNLRRRLPAVMMPERVLEITELPVTPVGKLDRGRLRREFAAHGDGPVADTSRVRKAVLAAWSAALRTAELLPHDHFFDLGGTPGDAVAVAAGLRDELALPLALDAVFTTPVLAEFLRVLDEPLD